MSDRIKRPNFYDFKTVTKEDLGDEQSSNLSQVAHTNHSVLGTGVKLEFPTEPIIFDSDNLSVEQAGWVSLDVFDGRGVLDEPYLSKDLSKGSQIAFELEDANINGYINTLVSVVGKTFDDTLIYEHILFENNGIHISYNHFKEVTNILFQNFLGNNNTTIDGYGSYNVGGRITITEASSMRVSIDCISVEQVLEPDIFFRNYKTYDSGKTLAVVLQEAIGVSNDVDDLDVKTSAGSTRTFAQGASTELIYAQKFQMNGNNIQKVSILLGLETGANWSGSLVLGLRRLQTSTSCLTQFLPDSEIEFDPDTAPIEEIIITQDSLESNGVVLNSESQQVDFIFSGTNISNPSLSGIEDGGYYALTIRRSGSTTTGTLFLEEAETPNALEQVLSVYQGGSWTDVPTSTMWFRIWSDNVKIASGIAFDEGVYLSSPKTILNSSGANEQNIVQNLNFVNTGENSENYVIVQKSLNYSDVEIHNRTGDQIFSRVEDAPEFSLLTQTETLELLETNPSLVVLARVKDKNAKSNPEITDKLYYPGLALGNVINIVYPGSDLISQNVIGSIITPNVLKPTLKYRIIAQEIFTDLFGDVDGDGDIDINDANLITDFDGYSTYLATTGSFTDAQQQTLILNRTLDILKLIRADLDTTDGYEISNSDLVAINNFIFSGTAFPNGESSLTRVRLEVEPLFNQQFYLDSDGNSLLEIETIDPDLCDPANFSISSNIDFSIEFVETWTTANVEVLDLRRFVATSFLDFNESNLTDIVESGGTNNFLIPGNLYLTESIKNLDGSIHPLDFEQTTVEITLPEGNTEGSVNLFDLYIVDKMKFSDGTFVTANSLSSNQVKFSISVSSHVKNVSDGTVDGYVDFDGYNDGYGANADEAIATYIDHDTGILRVRGYNIVENEFFPELRSRIVVNVMLKKAGWINSVVEITSSELTQILQPIT